MGGRCNAEATIASAARFVAQCQGTKGPPEHRQRASDVAAVLEPAGAVVTLVVGAAEALAGCLRAHRELSPTGGRVQPSARNRDP